MRISLNLPEETILALHREALQHPDEKSRTRLMAIYYIGGSEGQVPDPVIELYFL